MIFISIAAYRDKELQDTIDSLIDNSTEKLHISIVEQCTPRERVKVADTDRVKFSIQWMRPQYAKGAGYARNLALQKYAGESHFLQIDAHTDLIQNWDEKMIAELNLASEIAGGRVILSQYPAAYEPFNNQRYRIPNHDKYKAYPQKQVPYIAKGGQVAAKRVDKETNLPEESTMVLAGYIFGPGEFATVPYDPAITFWGEELMITIQAMLHGYRIYSPSEMFVWHHYGRRSSSRIWNDHPDWAGMNEASIKHQIQVLQEYLPTSTRNRPGVEQLYPIIKAYIDKQIDLLGQQVVEQDVGLAYLMKNDLGADR